MAPRTSDRKASDATRRTPLCRTHRLAPRRRVGANDGIVSTESLVIGVAAAEATRGNITVADVAGLVAGAMSMAAGEYVSVSSQADTERADLDRERKELATDGDVELSELAGIYVRRGLGEPLAQQVAKQLMAHDALAAHARDELGISDTMVIRPVRAAVASAATFAVGGGMSAYVGEAPIGRGVRRVTFWGALAMALTAGVGALFGVAA